MPQCKVTKLVNVAGCFPAVLLAGLGGSTPPLTVKIVYSLTTPSGCAINSISGSLLDTGVTE